LVNALLRACPRLQILATSREPLDVSGELVRRLSGLALPDSSSAIPDQVERSAAARLFCERARSLAPGFALLPGDAVALASLCQRLDGLPLALEIAAAWTPVLSVEEILARVDGRPGFLTRGRREDAARHQSLRAALDWSFDLLTGPERALFVALSVFAGGFALDAVEAVGAGTEVGPEGILDVLAR